MLQANALGRVKENSTTELDYADLMKEMSILYENIGYSNNSEIESRTSFEEIFRRYLSKQHQMDIAISHLFSITSSYDALNKKYHSTLNSRTMLNEILSCLHENSTVFHRILKDLDIITKEFLLSYQIALSTKQALISSVENPT